MTRVPYGYGLLAGGLIMPTTFGMTAACDCMQRHVSFANTVFAPYCNAARYRTPPNLPAQKKKKEGDEIRAGSLIHASRLFDGTFPERAFKSFQQKADLPHQYDLTSRMGATCSKITARNLQYPIAIMRKRSQEDGKCNGSFPSLQTPSSRGFHLPITKTIVGARSMG
ncbi:hypothetical protein CTAM01_08853 [Colletotrichum tamarilloi]|uniref:Uncharacterized protein n=1 Tax=Colletotrichum tamarilloi TaxID=1209934 RepID=A0ABQ9R561_9PEZI|nr:uncharacterized protein CTAM01_08853 [Colletotrichum tamarilloi]KAK1494840.1 hypothetical protein CTAM01_08853 [Colletotrichum tamarilloi]